MVDSSWVIANGERNEHTYRPKKTTERCKRGGDEGRGEGLIQTIQTHHNTKTQPHTKTSVSV